MGIFRARTKLGFTPSTAVRTNIQAPNLDTGIGQALIGAGKIGLQLKQKLDKQNSDIEFSQYKTQVGLNNVKRGAEISGELDSTKHPDIYKKWAEVNQSIMPKGRDASRRAGIFNNEQSVRDEVAMFGGMLRTSNDNWNTQTAMQMAGIKTKNDLASFNRWIDERQKNKPIPASQALKLRTEAAKVQAAAAIENSTSNAFGVWAATGDLQKAFDSIEADPNVPADDKQEVESELKTRVENRRAEDKIKVEQADAQSVETISGWINDGELAGITERIKELPLTETRKREEIKNAKDYIRAVNGYKTNVVTSNETRIKVLALTTDIKNRLISRDEAITAYTQIANTNDINTTDGKSFINGIFSAAEDSKDTAKQRNNSVLQTRERQLRDAIESQPNVFDPQIATEILKDFANEAVIELGDKFRDGEFTNDELDLEVNRLMNKFTLSEIQQTRAAIARELRLADTLEKQQSSITKQIEALRKEGKPDEAKALMDESISLGIFEIDGDKVKKKKGKKRNLGKGFLDRIFNR